MNDVPALDGDLSGTKIQDLFLRKLYVVTHDCKYFADARLRHAYNP